MVIDPRGGVEWPDPDEQRAFWMAVRWAIEYDVKHPTLYGAVAARRVKEDKERSTK